SAASSATVFPTRPAGYSLLHLANGGSVEGAGVLNVLNLAVEAGTGPAADNFGVNLTGANTVTSLARNVTTSAATAGKAFTFNNATDLTVGTVDGVTGVTTNNGNITLRTHGTTMSLTEAVNAGTANVTLDLAGNGDATATQSGNGSITANGLELLVSGTGATAAT